METFLLSTERICFDSKRNLFVNMPNTLNEMIPHLNQNCSYIELYQLELAICFKLLRQCAMAPRKLHINYRFYCITNK